MRVWGLSVLGFRVSASVCRSNPKTLEVNAQESLDSWSGFGLLLGAVQRTPESWNMGLGGLLLGSLILYLKGMRTIMFQLYGYYCRSERYRHPMYSPTVAQRVCVSG